MIQDSITVIQTIILPATKFENTKCVGYLAEKFFDFKIFLNVPI